MPVDKVKLISTIHEAFKDVVLGNGIGLSEADAIDSYSDMEFRLECRQKDEKYHWTEISSEALNTYNCSLNYFDAEGMRFHLPAFLIADIKGDYRFGMSFTLTHLSEYSKSQFELLNKHQRRAVKMYLDYMLEQPNYLSERSTIVSAIDNYWSV